MIGLFHIVIQQVPDVEDVGSSNEAISAEVSESQGEAVLPDKPGPR